MNVKPTNLYPSAACLTDEQIDDQLIGDLAPSAAVHLAACELCQARLAAAEAPMVNFREVSLAWAERQSATLPTRPVATSRAPHRLAWASAATAVLAIGIAIPVMRERLNTPAAPTRTDAPAMAAVGHTGMSSVTPVAATPEQIDRDNQMLEAIERELDAPADSPAAYGLVPTAGHNRAHARTVRD